MIVIDQGGEWLWQKVQNIPNSLKRMRYSIAWIIQSCHFARLLRILSSFVTTLIEFAKNKFLYISTVSSTSLPVKLQRYRFGNTFSFDVILIVCTTIFLAFTITSNFDFVLFPSGTDIFFVPFYPTPLTRRGF